MGLERFPDEAIGLENYVELTAVATLTVAQQRVRITAGAAFDLTLPPVNEAIGKFYSVIIRNGTTNIVTVVDQGDSEIAVSIAIAVDNGYAVLYSDGICWYPLVSVIV